MKLATIELDGRARAAVVVDDEVIDLTEPYGAGLDDVTKLLVMGAEGRALVERCMQKSIARRPCDAVRFRSPIGRIDKLLGVGMNYRCFIESARQFGMQSPAHRLWFSRPQGCVVGPHDPVWMPRHANDLDYEAELAIVIGRRCRYVTKADAPAVIGGFTIANDMTLRERATRSLVLGKSFDTHTPLGPWLVTPDEVGDPHALQLSAWVNGALRQQASTADMIANCYELLAELSATCTLNPGDVILTGTPGGCGMFQRPPEYLAVGDVVRIQIERIGSIENQLIDEPF